MSNYQKFTLQTIREKLKNGDYKNLVGANRAIGKTQELSDEDKAKAKALAAKHFGVDVPAKKPAKKRVSRKAPAQAAAAPSASKKVTKKAARKTAKKGAKRAARVARSPAAPSATDDDAQGASSGSGGASAGHGADTITEMGKVISTLDQALKAMETAKHLFPKAELEAGVTAATVSMTRAVRVLDNAVLAPLLPNEPAAKPSVGGKPKGKRGKRAKTASPAPVAKAAEEVAEETEDEEGEEPPTQEELEQLEIARQTMPPLRRGRVVDSVGPNAKG